MSESKQILLRLVDRTPWTEHYQQTPYNRPDGIALVRSDLFLGGVRYGTGYGPNGKEAREMAAANAIPFVVALLDQSNIFRTGACS
jgi:hypothetical protein